MQPNQSFKYDKTLVKILKEQRLFDNLKVLDLGIGKGFNSLYLASQGAEVTGVDRDLKNLQLCNSVAKDNLLKINFINSDIENYTIPENKYNLIIARNVLNYFDTQKFDELTENISKKLKNNGVFYMVVFSKSSIQYEKIKNSINHKAIDNCCFEITNGSKKGEYINFFSKQDILKLFNNDFLTLNCEEIDSQIHNSEPTKIIIYIGKKI